MGAAAHPTCRRTRFAGCCATGRWSGLWRMPTACRCRSAARPARYRPSSAGLWRHATAGAGIRAATTPAGWTRTTSATGWTAARRVSTIWFYFARTTTVFCTRGTSRYWSATRADTTSRTRTAVPSDSNTAVRSRLAKNSPSCGRGAAVRWISAS